jgi:hypothetical protein
MPKIQTLSDEDRALGIALAEKANLDPAVVVDGYSVNTYGDTVSIHFEVVHSMPRSEFKALFDETRNG